MADPLAFRSPLEVRLACRRNALKTVASRALSGYLCVNVVMMDEAYAAEFEKFCRANPKPCPLLAVIPAGRPDCPEFARGLDIRTDLGSYDVIRDGVVVERRQDVVSLFSGDMVTFLIGSSVSFDGLLVEKGYEPAFGPCIQLTGLDCEPAGRFRTKMAVTMRSFLPDRCDPVWEYTSHFPACHGAPLGRNNGRELGIQDLDTTISGNPIKVPQGTDRLYWACGVTPSLAAQQARLPFALSYTPGHALITDIPTESLYEA
ncbi:MAG: DUF1445 domain-containing protein [Gemmatimonadota bacterium]|nr:DUF1445 domain-containing protein [Gemmatimonadota bacterium]